ncbi:MAG: hypothetical protein IKG93_04240 [Clostridiales bacterium]|nr:hypothetical protein [Clostridiales bacterium]
MKDTFDKIVMDEGKKEEILQMLQEKKTVKSRRWIPVVAGLAAAAAILIAVPYTRKAIVRAAEEILSVFRTPSNLEYTVSISDDAMLIEASDANGGLVDLAEAEDGRLYFVLNGERTDVTDKCSATDFYRHEIKNPDGSRTVIFVGGTADDFGWWETTIVDGEAGQEAVLSIGKADFKSEWMKNAFEAEGLEQAVLHMNLGGEPASLELNLGDGKEQSEVTEG